MIIKDEILFDNEWLQLKKLSSDDDPQTIKGYVYSHEKRCNGQIIVIVPYRILEKEDQKYLQFLLRLEDTPCWSKERFPQVIPCSFTGGVDNGSNPVDTTVKELMEESGYEIKPEELISLGTCKGTKSTDTTYYIFSCDLSNKEQTKELTIESEHERMSSCEWVLDSEILEKPQNFLNDSMLAAGLMRLYCYFRQL